MGEHVHLIMRMRRDTQFTASLSAQAAFRDIDTARRSLEYFATENQNDEFWIMSIMLED